MADCVPGGTLKLPDVMTARDLIGTVTANYRQTGLTTWYNSSVSGGMEDIGCADAASKLTTAFQNSYNVVSTSSPVSTILSKAAGTQEGKTYTFNDYQLIYDSLVKGAFTSANAALGQTAAEAATTSLTASTISYALECMKELASVKNQSLCEAAGLINSDAMEQFKNDSVQNANFFTSIMYSSMAFMTFLFFALSPIVIVVCLIWPMHAVKLFMAYMMFGMWVSSWAVFYAPMGFFIQNEVQNVFAAYAKSGDPFTLANFSSVYADLSTKLAVASNAIATIPLLALALLSGSFFSINSIASRFSGEAHSDPSQMSNRLRSNAALEQGAPERTQNTFNHVSTAAGSKQMEVSMSMTDSILDSSAKSWGLKDVAMSKTGVSWKDAQNNTHTVATSELQKWGHDFDKAKSIGAAARGIAASEVLNETETKNLSKFAAENQLSENNARSFAGNLAFLNAQRKHDKEDVAGMLAGEYGTAEQDKAKGYLRAENRLLLGHNEDVNKVMAAAVLENGVDKAVAGSLGKIPVAGGLAAGVSAGISKAVGDINARADKTSSERYMTGKGWEQKTTDGYGRVWELSKNLSADVSNSIEQGKSFTINSTNSATAGYTEKWSGEALVGLMTRWQKADPDAFEKAYQPILDIENGYNETKKTWWEARVQESGLMGSDGTGQRAVKMANWIMMHKSFDYGALRGKAIDNSTLQNSVPQNIDKFDPAKHVQDMGGWTPSQAKVGFDAAQTQEIQEVATSATQSAALGNKNFSGKPLDGLITNQSGQTFLDKQEAAAPAVINTLSAPDSDGKAHPVAAAATKKAIPGAAPYQPPGSAAGYVPKIKDSGEMGTGNLMSNAGRSVLGVKNK